MTRNAVLMAAKMNVFPRTPTKNMVNKRYPYFSFYILLAAYWRYQTHVKKYRIFSRLLLRLKILVYHCVYVYIYIYVCICICICIYIYMYVYVYVYIYINLYIYIYIYIYIYKCMYTHTHTHTHTHIYNTVRSSHKRKEPIRKLRFTSGLPCHITNCYITTLLLLILLG